MKDSGRYDAIVMLMHADRLDAADRLISSDKLIETVKLIGRDGLVSGKLMSDVRLGASAVLESSGGSNVAVALIVQPKCILIGSAKLGATVGQEGSIKHGKTAKLVDNQLGGTVNRDWCI